MITYLASPYSDRDASVQHSRYEAACRACLLLVNSGANPYSPICHWHPIAELGYYMEYDALLTVDLAILKVSTSLYVLCLDGWKESVGVRREIDFAKEHKIKTSYHTIKDLLVTM